MKNKNKFISLYIFRSLLAQVLSALVYMNVMNIIHLDIKPSNIMIKNQNKETKFYLID